jgi:hypothetical protein
MNKITLLLILMVAPFAVLNGQRPRIETAGRPSSPSFGETSSHALKLVQGLSLCARDEEVIFSCTISGSGKLLSLCGSRGLDAQSGYVQYRFGRAGRLELEFPQAREKTQSAFRYTRYTRPLVTYLVLRFESNGYLYSIHQNDNAEERPPVREASVTVTPLQSSNPKTTELRCRLPYRGSLMSLEDIVPRAEEETLDP